jgi:hypothetical protein
MPLCYMMLLVIPLSPLVTLVTLQYVTPDQTPPTPTSVTYFVNGLIKLLTISLLLSKQCFCFKEVKVNQTQLPFLTLRNQALLGY